MTSSWPRGSRPRLLRRLRELDLRIEAGKARFEVAPRIGVVHAPDDLHVLPGHRYSDSPTAARASSATENPCIHWIAPLDQRVHDAVALMHPGLSVLRTTALAQDGHQPILPGVHHVVYLHLPDVIW